MTADASTSGASYTPHVNVSEYAGHTAVVCWMLTIVWLGGVVVRELDL